MDTSEALPLAPTCSVKNHMAVITNKFGTFRQVCSVLSTCLGPELVIVSMVLGKKWHRKQEHYSETYLTKFCTQSFQPKSLNNVPKLERLDYLSECNPQAYTGHSSQHLHSLAVCTMVAWSIYYHQVPVQDKINYFKRTSHFHIVTGWTRHWRSFDT